MAVALAALFVALSGTAVAAGVPGLAKRALVADNAKKLGGQSPSALLATAKQAAEASASAAAQQPGPASTAAGLVSVKTGSWNLNPNSEADFTIACDAGAKAVGGGWDDPRGFGHGWDSRPSADGSSWRVYITMSANAPGGQSGTLYAVCLK
jgi:hypothetical protein